MKLQDIRTPIALTLKAAWRFDASRRVFVDGAGGTFDPYGDLPPRTRIAYMVPGLVQADESRLSDAERNLRRSMHVILPARVRPEDYVAVVRAWPAVDAAEVAPRVSLPASPP